LLKNIDMENIEKFTELTGTQSGYDQKENGRIQVLGIIRHEAQIARIDIAAHTGVSPATVTSITSDLINAGLVEEISPETGKSDAKRGRPRVALKIRGSAHTIAGLKISDRSIKLALVDFEGNVIGDHDTVLPAAKLTSIELATVLQQTLHDASVKHDLSVGDLSGIGIGIAGMVNAPRGDVYWSPTLRERNVPLQTLLSEALSVPVFVDNDANLVAKAEQLFGYGKNARDFIVVTIENGVGMGIVINNEIYRGHRGCGAEFGHTKVQLDGALCRCGQRGCLEAYVADYALLREVATIDGKNSKNSSGGNLKGLFDDAKAGDETAKMIFQRAGRMFAMGLANLVNIFDPQLIILSGERMEYDYLYADEVIASMKDLAIQVDTAPPLVRIHKWGDLMWAKGAAAYAIEGVTDIAVRQMS
jgi:transcriptional regulator of PTS gene